MYAVAMSCSDVWPFICSQRNFSWSDRSRKRSVAVFLRMEERWPSTFEATSASSNEPAGTRAGRDWMNATPLPIWRTSKPSPSSSRRTSSSRRARRDGSTAPPRRARLELLVRREDEGDGFDVQPGGLQTPASDFGHEV